MLYKIVVLFLAFMAILAMFGKLKMPGASRLADKRCRSCGRLKIGKGPCPCKKKG